MSMHIIGDTATLTGRSLRHILRSPDTVITTAVMPIAMMLLFVFVFGGAIDTGEVPYVDYLLPGILLITVANTSYRLFEPHRVRRTADPGRVRDRPRFATHASLTPWWAV